MYLVGPLLFLIYINDITESAQILIFYLFADDTVTLFSHKDPKVIVRNCNAEMKKVSEWLLVNKLSLNVSKSNFIILRTPQKKYLNTIKIKIDNANVEEKAYIKYLGIMMDEKLTWNQHIHHVNLKLSKGIGIIAKLRHLLCKSAIKMIYYSFIQPYINYGLLNWGCATNKNLDCIKKSMDKVIRLIVYLNVKTRAINS